MRYVKNFSLYEKALVNIAEGKSYDVPEFGHLSVQGKKLKVEFYNLDDWDSSMYGGGTGHRQAMKDIAAAAKGENDPLLDDIESHLENGRLGSINWDKPIKLADKGSSLEFVLESLNEARAPKNWDSMFTMKAIEAYEKGEFNLEDDKSIAEWDKEFNGGRAPKPAFNTKELVSYAIKTGEKPDGSKMNESLNEKEKPISFNGKKVDVDSIEIEDIDTRDHPDYSDAFIAYAEYTNGKKLSDTELENFQDENYELVNWLIHDKQLYM